jgi:hypothetical protein
MNAKILRWLVAGCLAANPPQASEMLGLEEDARYVP